MHWLHRHRVSHNKGIVQYAKCKHTCTHAFNLLFYIRSADNQGGTQLGDDECDPVGLLLQNLETSNAGKSWSKPEANFIQLRNI